MPVAYVIMDVRGVILEFDDAAESLLGYARDEALGRRASDMIIPPRLRAAHDAGLRRYRDTGQGPLLDNRFELPALRRDGSEIMIDLLVSRTVYEGRPAFAGRLQALHQPTSVPGELHLHADFHRALVEQSPIMVAVLDSNGVPTWRSANADGLLSSDGRPLEEQLTGLVHPADLEKARQALREAGRIGLDNPVELRVKAVDGSWRALSLLACNLLAHPAVHGTALYATDVSRARAAERQTRIETTRLMTLIESLNVAVLLEDEHRRVVLANSAFVEMFSLGVAPERLRGATGGGSGGSPMARLYAVADDVERRTEAAIHRGRPLRGEEITLIDGRVLERDFVPIMLDGSTLGFLWVFRDVTAQAEIRRGLEDRARMLSELSALKTEFIGVVSHELRTPLASINTFATLLEDDAALSGDERTAATAAIRRNADRMHGLVADLILLAKLESGELVLDHGPVDVPALVRDAAENLIPGGEIGQGPDPTLRLDLHDGPGLPGDAELLSQLIHTAIGVLVVGSAQGAEVVVRAEPQRGGWRVTASTSAADSAITERLLAIRLSHPDAADDFRTGALAVMLARAIAARHGGELSIAVHDRGATLTIDLPIRP
jgi:PAS domain S-box-containing protein